MARKIKQIEKELDAARSLLDELKATVPDPDTHPKAEKAKYPPAVQANVRDKVERLEAELKEARGRLDPYERTADDIRRAVTKKK